MSIIEAAHDGDLEGIRRCLSQGGNINTTGGSSNETALQYAVKNNRKQAVFLLLDRGADVNYKDKAKHTALHDVFRNGYLSDAGLEIFKALLRANADVNACNQDGRTPLMRALQSQSETCVKELLERGAKVNAVDNEGKSVIDYSNARMLRILLDKAGADIPFDQRKKTFLRAIEQEDMALAEVLIEKCGADMDAIKTQLSVERKTLVPYIATIDQRIEEKKQKTAREAEEEKKRRDAEADPWKIALPDIVSRITWTWSHMIVEHFNFKSRERTTIMQNRDTKAEIPALREGFDEMKNRAYLEEAFAAFRERGGQADAGVLLSGYSSRPGQKPLPKNEM